MAKLLVGTPDGGRRILAFPKPPPLTLDQARCTLNAIAQRLNAEIITDLEHLVPAREKNAIDLLISLVAR